LQRRVVLDFTTEEVSAALKSLKPKMSSGMDDIPAKIVKMSSPALIEVYRRIFNNILKHGLPSEWRVAKVIAPPKESKNH